MECGDMAFKRASSSAATYAPRSWL
jgi:hypothetical protein